MKWNHLPVEGGWYAQHPDFADKMLFLIDELNKQQEREHQAEMAKSKAKSGRGRGR